MAEIRRDEGIFPARDGLKLFWISSTPAQPKAHLAVVHGYAEHIGRYAHVFDHFASQGFAVHGFDCRGHGRSEGRRGYCRRFGEYLDDLADFLEKVGVAAGGQKIFLLGHSHGALISARYGLGDAKRVAGMVLTSPYFRLALAPSRAKILAATLVGKVIPWLPVSNEIDDRQLTRDLAMVEAHRTDPLVIPNATPRWFGESTAAQLDLLSRAGQFTHPLAIFSGGADPIADSRAGQEFHQAAGSADKSFKAYPGALHEVMNETNRAEVLADIQQWLEQRV